MRNRYNDAIQSTSDDSYLMKDGRKPGGILGRFARSVRSALSASDTDRAPKTERGTAPPASAPASSPSANELLDEGLRLRLAHGVAAAVPFFERAAQLEPNSHLPFFMLGNAATELGDLDAAVLRDLRHMGAAGPARLAVYRHGA